MSMVVLINAENDPCKVQFQRVQVEMKRQADKQIATSQRTGENLMAVTSQRTGFDLRAGAAHSHLQESNRNKGHYEVLHTGNNQGRSTLGNVFNRFGRRADMRETLNRRREQEHSQHSTAEKV